MGHATRPGVTKYRWNRIAPHTWNKHTFENTYDMHVATCRSEPSKETVQKRGTSRSTPDAPQTQVDHEGGGWRAYDHTEKRRVWPRPVRSTWRCAVHAHAVLIVRPPLVIVTSHAKHRKVETLTCTRTCDLLATQHNRRNQVTSRHVCGVGMLTIGAWM